MGRWTFCLFVVLPWCPPLIGKSEVTASLLPGATCRPGPPPAPLSPRQISFPSLMTLPCRYHFWTARWRIKDGCPSIYRPSEIPKYLRIFEHCPQEPGHVQRQIEIIPRTGSLTLVDHQTRARKTIFASPQAHAMPHTHRQHKGFPSLNAAILKSRCEYTSQSK